MEKKINSKCICSINFNLISQNLVVVFPCEHIFHKNCIKSSKNICLFCENKILKIYSFKEIKNLVLNQKKTNYYQNYVDMLCVKNFSDSSEINKDILFTRCNNIFLLLNQLIWINNKIDVDHLINLLLYQCNIKLKIKNKKNIYNGKKIIISNHTSLLDAIIIFKIFGCGFLSSAVIKDIPYIYDKLKFIPLLFINRGKSENTVEKIKDFVQNQEKDLCVFPEGFITHPNIIAQFRTGVFYSECVIQPIILKYKPLINDNDYFKFFFKIFSQNIIEVDVTILEIFEPPFNNNKIEMVRTKMAKCGNFALSRISNKDMKD